MNEVRQPAAVGARLRCLRAAITLLAAAGITSCGDDGKPSSRRVVTPETAPASKAVPAPPPVVTPPPVPLTPGEAVAEGKRIFKKRNCAQCHAVEPAMPKMGPNLMGVGARLDTEQLRIWIENPKAKKPSTLMPAWGGSAEELRHLLAYLETLR
jgi:cytochrome c2